MTFVLFLILSLGRPNAPAVDAFRASIAECEKWSAVQEYGKAAEYALKALAKAKSGLTTSLDLSGFCVIVQFC